MRPSSQETADLFTFTEIILNEKLHFLSSVSATTFSSVDELRDYDLADDFSNMIF